MGWWDGVAIMMHPLTQFLIEWGEQ